jgi:hypothetical protein
MKNRGCPNEYGDDENRKAWNGGHSGRPSAQIRIQGILLRRAVALPIEKYSPKRKAEFLLNNAVTSEDYEWALKAVKKLGVDPKSIPRDKPRR